MIACEDARPDLSAVVDGERPATDPAALREHLERCRACSAALEELRLECDERVGLFRAVQATAPRPPAGVGGGGRIPESRRRVRRALILAAAVLGILLLLPFARLGRSAPAAEVVAESARAWGRVAGVELLLHLRVELGGAEGLSREWWFRGSVQRPDRYLFGEVQGREGAISTERPLFGSDGERRWSWEPEAGRLTTGAEADRPLRLRSGLLHVEVAGDRARLLRFLYRELPARLAEPGGTFDVVSVEREGGARRYLLAPGEELDQGLLARLESVEVRLARSTGQLEGLRAKATLAEHLSFELELHTLAVDPEIDPAVFRWRTHLPPGVAPSVEEK